MDILFYDFIELPSNANLDDFGFLRVPGVFARVGVQNYSFNDGSTKRILRPIEEVKKSTDKFNMVPVTLNHPGSFVSPQNAKQVSVGTLSKPEFRGGLLSGQFLVSDQEAINAASTSHSQLSAGYTAEVEERSGVWVDKFGVQGRKGESYEFDFIQKDIRPNHVALVEAARAGAIASLKLDSDSTVDLVGVQISDNKEQNMTTKVIDGSVVYTLDGEDAAKVATLISKLKTENSNLVDSAKELDSLKSKLQDAETKLGEAVAAKSKLEDQVKELEDTIAKGNSNSTELVEKLKIWNVVSPHLDSIEPDFELPVSSVKKLYLVTRHPELTDALKDNSSDGFIEGLWTAYNPEKENKSIQDSQAEPETVNDGLEDIRKYFTQRKIKTQDHTQPEDPINEARNAYIQDLENRYKAVN